MLSKAHVVELQVDVLHASAKLHAVDLKPFPCLPFREKVLIFQNGVSPLMYCIITVVEATDDRP